MQTALLKKFGSKWNARDLLPDLLFWLFVVVIVYIRVQVYQQLNMVYIDSDQPHMWLGAKDYAAGLFYEPRYYGQAYNTFLEALVAVPFLKMGYPVYAAVPLATHVLFLFPVFFTALYLYFKKRKWNALIVLSFILLMPNGYHFMTSLPRGFVTGIFFTSFFIASILEPNRLVFVFVNTLLAVLAYSANPNSVLVSAPVLFYLFLCNFKEKKYYLATGAGLLVWLPVYFIFDRFYQLHPGYIIHQLHYSISTEYFADSFKDLDRRFIHISLFQERHCLWLLLVMTLTGVLLFRWNRKAFYSFLIFIAVVLVSFCTGKTRDGSTWVYFSYSRMYLGVPVLLYLLLSVKQINIPGALGFLFVVPLAFVWQWQKTFPQSVKEHAKVYHWEAVTVLTLEDAFEAIDFYGKFCRENGAQYMAVSGGFWLNSVLSYGGPAIRENYPLTEDIRKDRRYWVRDGNNDTVFKTIVLLAGKSDLEKYITARDGFSIKNIDGYGLYLVTNNRLTKRQFKKRINDLEFGDAPVN